MALIEFKNVGFSYPNGFSAVENVSFEIEKGENIAIVGQNGAGKTTTVKMINGLLKPTEGTVIVDGKDTKDYTTAQLSRTAGYVFQNPDDQIFHNSVEEEIEYGPKVLKFDQERMEELIQYAAKHTNLQEHMDENPYNLPLSVRKFVTIASIIAMDTDIIILDEPTAGQDVWGIRILESLLREFKAQGKTVITITHDMEFVVNNFEKVFVMAHKNLLKVTDPRNVFADEELLNESMLMKPYIREVASNLGLPGDILSKEDLIAYLKK